MKVIIATPLYPPEIGGPATYAKTLEAEFSHQNVHGTVLPFSCTKGLPKYLRHFAYAYHLFRASYGADIIYALDPVSVGLPSALVALSRGKKFVLKIVGDYAWEQGQQRFGVTQNLDEFVKLPSNKFLAQVGLLRMAQIFVARRAVSIIVPSYYLKGIVMEWGIPEQNISVVYNAFLGIGELPSREAVRRDLALPPSVPIVVSAGRLVPWKGFATLIGAIEILRREHADIRLYIAGGGPDEEALRALIVEKNLVDSVILLGSIKRDVLLKYVRAGDCFVLNTGYEGLSHQLLEVLAVGTPVITTNVGGNVEIIKDGETGQLVEFNDMAKLVEAMSANLRERAHAEEMAVRGKEFVAQFTVERMVRETVHVLDLATK